MTSIRSLLTLSMTTLAVCSFGCRTVDLNVDEHDRFSPSGRASYEFLPGNAQRRPGAMLDLITGRGSEREQEGARAVVQPTISIDGEITYVEGRDRQTIQAGDQAEIGDVVFAGPTAVRIETENLRGHLAARGGVRFWDVLSLEAILGLGVDGTEVRLRNATLDSRDEQIRPGFVWGVRGTVRPIALIDLYVQLTQNYMWDTVADDLQVGAELNLTRNVALFGGYRWWRYEEENFESGSDVDIDISGPTAGVSLKF